MKVYTNKQITKILKELHFLTQELKKEHFNSVGGEALSRAVAEILDVVLDGDDIKVSLEVV